MKYHIGKNGSPTPCEASDKACPLGGEHFASEKDAYAHLEQTHGVVPKPVRDQDIVAEFNAGKAFSISELLGVVDQEEVEKKKEERRQAFEAEKEAVAKAAVIDPNASRRLLIDKTKQLNDEKTTILNHTERIARIKKVEGLMAVIRRNDAAEIERTLKALGEDEEKDLKPVAPAPDRLAREEAAAAKDARVAEGKARLDQIWQDIDLGRDPFAKLPNGEALRPAEVDLVTEHERIMAESESILGPEGDSMGKIVEDAARTVSDRLKLAVQDAGAGKTAKELKTMLIAKLIKEL